MEFGPSKEVQPLKVSSFYVKHSVVTVVIKVPALYLILKKLNPVPCLTPYFSKIIFILPKFVSDLSLYILFMVDYEYKYFPTIAT
jgi:hypothetical protein